MGVVAWIKLKADGACKGNPGLSGAGAILRDSKACLIAAFCVFLGVQTSLYVEAEAMFLGINLAKDLGLL